MNAVDSPAAAELLVGRRLRDLRVRRRFSLRALADCSGLNVNTLSLIENGRTSASVSTLQQLAQALNVPITAFFELEQVQKRVVYTPVGQRPPAAFGSALIQSLGKELAGGVVQPFVVNLKPGRGSQAAVHGGYEFVYCFSGRVSYQIEQDEYCLKSGDSLLFEAYLPHRWENKGVDTAQFLLILYPSGGQDELDGRHFLFETIKKEMTMKIAAITDDGKTISQHFGRAPYYLVLTIEDGKIVNREMREKMGHNHFSNLPHTEEAHGAAGHGMDAASHDKHISMAEAIADCKALLCGGMGMGAYESMRRLNIQPVVTDLFDIDAAVQAFIDGKLVDHTEMLH